MEVNQTALGRILNLTTRQIRNLEGDHGMPGGRPAPGGKSRLYDLTVTVPWYLHRERERLKSTAKEEAETRGVQLKVKMAELELAEREGQLVPLDLYRATLAEVCTEIRSNLTNLPGTVGPQLVGADDAREVVAILVPAIDECLKSMMDLADQLEDDAGEALPDGFPGVGPLRAAGINTFERLRSEAESVTSIRGIGRATEVKILAALTPPAQAAAS